MIISHRYRYVFVQVPQTASSSIGEELCRNYAGEPILHKHALYRQFLKTASPEEKEYFVFAGRRNPLDCLVTEYFRRKEGKRMEDNEMNRRISEFIRANSASFQDYYREFHSHFHRAKNPYHEGADYLYRFENLQEDFTEVLGMLGIDQVRPIPRFNRTTGKDLPFMSYYTPDLQPLVRMTMGSRMRRAGYSFSPGWRSFSSATPLIFLRVLLNSAVFALRLAAQSKAERRQPGSTDVYSKRLKREYIGEENTSRDEASREGSLDKGEADGK
ncbi:MAG: sulfotransferase family 2 domain-containing protein [Candidatus Aegiribacteria sp.]